MLKGFKKKTDIVLKHINCSSRLVFITSIFTKTGRLMPSLLLVRKACRVCEKSSSSPNFQYHPVKRGGCTVIVKQSKLFIFASDYSVTQKSQERRHPVAQSFYRKQCAATKKKRCGAQRDRTNTPVIVFFCSIIGRERKMNSAETSEGKKRNKRRQNEFWRWCSLSVREHITALVLFTAEPCSNARAVRFSERVEGTRRCLAPGK